MKIILFFLLFVAGALQAQNQLADSLLAALPLAQTDTAKMELYCKLSKQYLLSDGRKASQSAQKAAELATATGAVPGQVKALNLLGNAYLIMGEYHKALQSHYQAKKLSEHLRDTTMMIATYINLGGIYQKLNDPARALKHLEAASDLALQVNDVLGMSKVYNNLGNIHEGKGEYNEALHYFRKAARLQEDIGNTKSLALSLHNIGSVHLLLEQPAGGLTYLFKSVKLNEEIQNTIMIMKSLGRIARLYQAMGNNTEALTFALRSYKMAEEVASAKRMADAAQILQAVYAAQQDYDQAYKYLMVYTSQTEILTAETRAKIEAEITARHENEQQELENLRLKAESERQETEIRHQRNSLLLQGTLIILMLVLVVVLYKSRKRVKAAYAAIMEAHRHMQVQKTEIINQKNEISSQALVLKEQNEQLEKHNAFKNKVFSIMSHDLRGPFSSFKGLLGLVQRGTMSQDEMKFIFGLLSKNMDNVTSMLDNVLIWAKSQLEESGISMQPVNLYELVEENIQLVKAQADEKQVTVYNKLAADSYVISDKERVNFVLRNLLVNALKFSYPGGNVIVRLEEREGEAVIAVEDNGKGITAEHQAMLFTEKRITTLGTSQEKGTGLGLMLCKELLESFRGSIGVTSAEGKGSVFYITLPQPKSHPAAGERLAEAELV